MRERCYDRVSQVRRDFRMSLVQPPDKIRVEINSDQVSQGFLQLHLKNLQGQRLHNVSGKLSPMLDCPWWFFVSSIKSEPPPLQVMTIATLVHHAVQYSICTLKNTNMHWPLMCFALAPCCYVRYWREDTLWWLGRLIVNMNVDISETVILESQ